MGRGNAISGSERCGSPLAVEDESAVLGVTLVCWCRVPLRRSPVWALLDGAGPTQTIVRNSVEEPSIGQPQCKGDAQRPKCPCRPAGRGVFGGSDGRTPHRLPLCPRSAPWEGVSGPWVMILLGPEWACECPPSVSGSKRSSSTSR